MIGFPIKKNPTNPNVNKQVKKTGGKNLSKGNLGMDFEEMINNSNNYYLDKNVAVIHKKPVPVQIVDVDYPDRQHAVITKAFYITPSTTDYNGIYRGKYIDFEAKETNSNTSFPLTNVHPHQVEHLRKIIEHGGIGFFIIYLKKRQKVYLLEVKDFLFYWDNKNEGRKSIPLDYIEDVGHLIPFGYLPELQYLKIVDEIYFNEEV